VRRLRAVLALLLVLFAVGAGGADDAWQSPLGRAHPLTGRIWDPAGATVVEAPVLVERLGRARYVLLGERHDNADHHRLQAELLRALVARGRRPAVAFEMFTTDDAPRIAEQLTVAPRDADGLADAVAWTRSGWPAWSLYRPIVQIALEAGLPIVAANLSATLTQSMRSGGPAALPATTAARLGLDVPMPREAQSEMESDLRRAHCGHGAAAMIERMALIQRARDAQMALSLTESDGGDGAVLITGAGHARVDRGVPMHLRGRRPSVAIVSVAFVEVSDAWTEPTAYAASTGGSGLPFDYVWFTPRVDAPDPCRERARPAG
jgi:uncharacterized iron-regulated protein